MSVDTAAAITAIAAATTKRPTIALVLGSGLGALGDEVRDAERIPYEAIPGWERSTAPGRVGRLIVAVLEGKTVAVMQGRLTTTRATTSRP